MLPDPGEGSRWTRVLLHVGVWPYRHGRGAGHWKHRLSRAPGDLQRWWRRRQLLLTGAPEARPPRARRWQCILRRWRQAAELWRWRLQARQRRQSWQARQPRQRREPGNWQHGWQCSWAPRGPGRRQRRQRCRWRQGQERGAERGRLRGRQCWQIRVAWWRPQRSLVLDIRSHLVKCLGLIGFRCSFDQPSLKRCWSCIEHVSK
mmetsp:Transcript_10690/g.22522  ORF Transcript_10690/g.22522 Transcript_10690/m.22522 type:complete len:204 (-) Transcript_10690:1500-2111(-)